SNHSLHSSSHPNVCYNTSSSWNAMTVIVGSIGDAISLSRLVMNGIWGFKDVPEAIETLTIHLRAYECVMSNLLDFVHENGDMLGSNDELSGLIEKCATVTTKIMSDCNRRISMLSSHRMWHRTRYTLWDKRKLDGLIADLEKWIDTVKLVVDTSSARMAVPRDD